MPLCKNPECRTRLSKHVWFGGYCSARCAQAHDGYDKEFEGPLLDPSDPTGEREIARNRDEVDAMLEAAAINKDLPKIIMLRKQGKTLRQIGEACGMSYVQCNRILGSVTPNLLRRCGLRIKKCATAYK